jgi:hypothetical protein
MPVCLAFALALTAQPVRAQVCAGFAGLRTTPIQFSAGAAFNTDASAFAGSVTAGKDLFGAISIGTTHYDALNASSMNVAVGGGYDFAVESSQRLFVCPSVGIQASFGPNDILGTGVDHDAKGFSFGFDVGGIALRNPRFQLIPTAGLGVVYSHDTFEDATGSASSSDAYGVFDAGLGFIIGQVFTIRPALSIPFALDESNVTFGLSFAINVGHRATAE